MPEVRLGQPEIIQNYDCSDIDGIKVYIMKGLEAKGDSINVKLSSIFGFKSLDVSGFKVL